MQGLFSALGRDFNRWIGWKRLGMAASLLVTSFAISTLVRMLKSIDASVILTALEDIPPRHIALAALWVVCAFCTLTFHDFLALRTIGAKHAPYRIAALSSFASYSIGPNIGATVFTGGAIRFRISSD
jgi:glycosyltransferase 2 family protein